MIDELSAGDSFPAAPVTRFGQRVLTLRDPDAHRWNWSKPKAPPTGTASTPSRCGNADPDPTARLLTDLNGGIDCKIHVTDLRTAEMVKYTSNAWRAVKVSFANEIGNIAKSAGLDGQQVLSILTSDLKVSMSPWFMRPGFAFGGSCLPKDVRALRAFAATRRTETPLLDAVLVANAEQIARAEAWSATPAPAASD